MTAPDHGTQDGPARGASRGTLDADPRTTHLVHLIRLHADRRPASPAILSPGREPVTYQRLLQQIDDTVAALNFLGIGRNDRVAIVLPDSPELAVALVAVGAGAASVPLNPAFRKNEFEQALADLDAKALLLPAGSRSPAVDVAAALNIRVVEMLPCGREAGMFSVGERHRFTSPTPRFAEIDDTFLVLHTSGTSARPKVVPLTHRNVMAATRAIASVLELSETDRCLSVMPLFHIHGLSAIFATLATGGTVICPLGFSASACFRWLDQFRPTWYTAAPTTHRSILEHARVQPDRAAHTSLRFIRSASSAMPRDLAVDLERTFHVPLIEAYGMTEAAPQIASNRLPPHVRKPGSVGAPAGPEVAVLDEHGARKRPEELGEIAIQGENVFTQGWLRTGDTGYLDGHGDLFVTGRLTDVINRGGEKISPAEIEAVLLATGRVREAVAFAVPHSTLGESVAAAVVLREGAERSLTAIRQFLGERLASFKMPHPLLIVDEIPLGSNGKLQRKRLAEEFGLLAINRSGESELPTANSPTPTEARLCALWSRILGVERLGIHDNFFERGGDSLTAMQALVRIQEELHVGLPLESVFERPTVGELAVLVDAHLPRARSVPIHRRSTADRGPLSFGQQRLWVLDQLEPGNPAYNMQVALRFSGPLDRSALERSLTEIRRRHEILRTTFPSIDGQPYQSIAPATTLRLPVIDLSGSADQDLEIQRLAAEEATTPFHLARGPLVRARLLVLDQAEHVLLLTMHHIVSDGWSTTVLVNELKALYASLVDGRPSPLDELPFQYGDFAVWQREWLNDQRKQDEIAYWRDALGGMRPALELPTDRTRPAEQTYRGARFDTVIGRETVEGLEVLSLQEGATLFMTVLASFQTLLLRYSGQDDVAVGTPIANRTHFSTALIGFFANTLVMRGDLSGDPSFREFLHRVRRVALGAYAHQDLPFEQIVEALQPPRSAGRTPLFQVMCAFQNLPDVSGIFASNLDVTTLAVGRDTAKFDLTLYVSESAGDLRATWQYNTDLFDEATIARMAASFQTLLGAVVFNPDCRLSALPLLDAGARDGLTTVPYRNTGVDAGRERPSGRSAFVDRFETQAALTPDQVAVRCGDEAVTYRALNERANRLARRLQRLHVGPGTLVGVCLTRSTKMPVALLGVWKAGGVYLPLDPEYPSGRLSFMLADSALSVLVTEERLKSLVPSASATAVYIDEDDDGQESTLNLVATATPDDLAYVIYTSGSTGRPKGVMITHGNVVHYVDAMRSTLEITADDRYLHTASLAFSSSMRQFLLGLSCGGTVVIARSDDIRDPLALYDLIKREDVSVVDVVPSSWRQAVRLLASLPPEDRAARLDNRVRLIVSASEPLLFDTPDEWTSGFGHPALLINMYGQTETTGIVATYRIHPDMREGSSTVPVGRAIADTELHVLDTARQPVPVGAIAEVYVGGAGVGRGYLNATGLTADRFVPDPYSDRSDARLYRTGDLARRRSDGNLELVGRIDDQIKIRGYRIDPAEIELTINAHHNVSESVVVARRDDTGGQRLVAFVVVRDRTPVDGEPSRDFEVSIRSFVKDRLPEYMVPTRVTVLAALPLTPNGKVDRKALPAPEDFENLPNQPPPRLRRSAEASAKAEGGSHSRTERGIRLQPDSAENVLVECWSRVLGMDRVGIDDNFFDLGGDSILAIQMTELANRAGLKVTPTQLFQHQTIASLARVVAPTSGVESVSRTRDMSRVHRVTLESVQTYSQEALTRAGLSAVDAAIMTEVQLEASLRGQPTHNIGAIPRYARRLTARTTNPQPQMRVDHETAMSAVIDGDNGPGQLVGVLAMELAIRKARESGIGIVGARRSNHFGAAGHYVWLAARENFIGLCTTNSALWLAPTGGLTPMFGTNPLGVGIPAAEHYPIVLDVSMSVAAKGKVAMHLAEGRALQSGWILDRSGRVSIDPADLAAGLGVPIGGHKGYGLALVMEVLAGVLTGAGFGLDHRRERMRDTNQRPDVGHFFMAFAPDLFMPRGDFLARVDRMIDEVKSSQRMEDVQEILIPGEAEMRARARNLRDGVPVTLAVRRALQRYREEAGLAADLVSVQEQVGA